MFDLAELKSWTRWDARAQRFLSDAAVPLRLKEIVKSYHNRVEEFYLWLGHRMEQIHAQAFEEWGSLNDQYRAVRPDG